jgi:hypothetical protein
MARPAGGEARRFAEPRYRDYRERRFDFAPGWTMRAVMLLVLAVPGAAFAQEVRGFIEVRGTGSVGVDGDPVQVVERVRPTMQAPLTDRLALVMTVEAALAQGRDQGDEVQRILTESDLGPLLDFAGCEWPTHSNERLGIDGVDDYLGVERLYVDAYSKQVDVRVGRQAVNWGSAQFLNPTDPFPEVLLSEPWRPRRGVNAVRANVPLGVHDVTAVAGANDDFTSLRAAGRVRLNAAETDFAVVGAYRQDAEDGLVGIDIRGTLGVGFWLEGALAVDDDPHEEIAVGLDYSFPVLESMIVAAQYYRNGAGGDGAALGGISAGIEPPECDQDGADELFGGEASDPFAPVLSGRDYLLISAMVGVSRDVSVSIAGLQNLGDGTGLLLPTVATSPTGWLEVSASAQIPVRTWGDGRELSPRDEDLQMSVEGPTGPITVDFSGLVPSAAITLWTRANF